MSTHSLMTGILSVYSLIGISVYLISFMFFINFHLAERLFLEHVAKVIVAQRKTTYIVPGNVHLNKIRQKNGSQVSGLMRPLKSKWRP